HFPHRNTGRSRSMCHLFAFHIISIILSQKHFSNKFNPLFKVNLVKLFLLLTLIFKKYIYSAQVFTNLIFMKTDSEERIYLLPQEWRAEPKIATLYRPLPKNKKGVE